MTPGENQRQETATGFRDVYIDKSTDLPIRVTWFNQTAR